MKNPLHRGVTWKPRSVWDSPRRRFGKRRSVYCTRREPMIRDILRFVIYPPWLGYSFLGGVFKAEVITRRRLSASFRSRIKFFSTSPYLSKKNFNALSDLSQELSLSFPGVDRKRLKNSNARLYRDEERMQVKIAQRESSVLHIHSFRAPPSLFIYSTLRCHAAYFQSPPPLPPKALFRFNPMAFPLGTRKFVCCVLSLSLSFYLKGIAGFWIKSLTLSSAWIWCLIHVFLFQNALPSHANKNDFSEI